MSKNKKISPEACKPIFSYLSGSAPHPSPLPSCKSVCLLLKKDEAALVLFSAGDSPKKRAPMCVCALPSYFSHLTVPRVHHTASEICPSAAIPVKRRQAEVMGSLSLCGVVHCGLPWEVLKASLVSPSPLVEKEWGGWYSSCLGEEPTCRLRISECAEKLASVLK